MTTCRDTKGPQMPSSKSSQAAGNRRPPASRVAVASRSALPAGERRGLVPRARTHERRLDALERQHAPRVPVVLVVQVRPGPDGKDAVVPEDVAKLATRADGTVIIEVRERASDVQSPPTKQAREAARARARRAEDEEAPRPQAPRLPLDPEHAARAERIRAAVELNGLDAFSREHHVEMSGRLWAGEISSDTYQQFLADAVEFRRMRAEVAAEPARAEAAKPEQSDGASESRDDEAADHTGRTPRAKS